jgi:hypothetical protein
MRMVRANLSALDPSLAQKRTVSRGGIDGSAWMPTIRWSPDVLR